MNTEHLRGTNKNKFMYGPLKFRWNKPIVYYDSSAFCIMAIRVVEFSNGGYKIIKIFAKESTYPKEIFEFWELD